MAQMVARFHGMEEVTGSNPVSSTVYPLTLIQFRVSGFFVCPWFKLGYTIFGVAVD